MSFNGNEGKQISLEEGAEFTGKYRAANPNSVKAMFYGRKHLEAILAQPDCQGIRIYLGADTSGDKVLVLAGADSAENDLLDVIVEVGIRCPPTCSGTNPLNSDLKTAAK
ncbi:hypothetical protein [Fluviicola sp.]|jgi:hypothetical protein|uniref:hypothetical protein n=1 Tax=Fluviicola sp. TaxID=1917219 RepID=UPI0028375D71|nr:hypothetical protein [Fluviicola sp.]MDR0802672.1 hypothetical protein [Fluviicola sp.]